MFERRDDVLFFGATLSLSLPLSPSLSLLPPLSLTPSPHPHPLQDIVFQYILSVIVVVVERHDGVGRIREE